MAGLREDEGRAGGRGGPSRLRRWALRLVAALALGGGAFGLVELAAHRPDELPFSPRCAFRMLTGLRCPGCGLTRAVHHALQGRIGEAVRLNPLIVAMPLVFAWLAWLFGAMLVRGEVPRMPAPPTGVGWALFAGLLVFWVVRVVNDLTGAG